MAQLRAHGQQQQDQQEGEKLRVTVSGMPAGEFVRWFSRRTGQAVILDEDLVPRQVSLELTGQSVQETITALARHLGTDSTQSGSLWIVGEAKAEDRAVLVRRVGRFGGEQLREIVQGILSDVGNVWTSADGVCVVSDRVAVLSRVQTVLDEVEVTESPLWVVQLHLIRSTIADAAELAIDVEPSLEAAAVAGAVSSGTLPGVPFASIEARLQTRLRAARSREALELLGEPVMVLSDGEKSVIASGERFRVPRRSVSDQGTVQTTGFESIETGLRLEIDVREQDQRSARVTVRYSNTTVLAISAEGVPRTAGDEFESVAGVTTGGVYLLGAYREASRGARSGGRLTIGGGMDNRQTVVEIWLRVQRVGGLPLIRPAGLTGPSADEVSPPGREGPSPDTGADGESGMTAAKAGAISEAAGVSSGSDSVPAIDEIGETKSQEEIEPAGAEGGPVSPHGGREMAPEAGR